MNLGNEIKRDACPQKYCEKSSVLKECMPIIIASLVVAYFSGSLFQGSGLDTAVTIIIEVAFVCLLYGIFYIVFKRAKERLSETYISVCENGICGICPMTLFKNKSFSVLYSDIKNVVVKGERIYIYTATGNIALTLCDVASVATLIEKRRSSN